MLTEKIEEILEAVWSAAENGESSVDAVKHSCAVTVTTGDLNELESKGLLTVSDGVVQFTEVGRKWAERVTRLHRLAEVLVVSILTHRQEDMEDIACRIEHSLLPEVEESICTLLGHPTTCPDGKPIPKGRCCTHGTRVVDSTVKSLAELQPGEKGKITFIKPIDHDNLHQLISLGLHPGVEVSVHRVFPAFCIKYGNTELALDESIVSRIFVWKLGDSAES
jgi:DtxR family Mn-dependent transcriptional regulator